MDANNSKYARSFTDKEKIRKWLEEGKAKGFSHMLLTIHWEPKIEPVYALTKEDAMKKHRNTQSIPTHNTLEIFSFENDIEEQLDNPKANWNW